MGSNARGILKCLHARTGKKQQLRDVHNIIQSQKREMRGSKTSAERSVALFEEFCQQDGGNTAKIVVDSVSKVVQLVVFQSARMKRMFQAFCGALPFMTYSERANSCNTHLWSTKRSRIYE
ncbi:hypothetical protein PC115_g8270 [Phytophthora cactorum]|uniref:ZSWIM1/3 RNaseH-like domain-containing protein n=1 Tax=Phytophthora cactorum TaxID=29920 RepID=A0A8T1CPB8_9STRA|nr:hypothetical protein PC115_g8270 [Phytophthora cactorum]